MNNKYKIIALFGKSGAGKDTIQKWMVENLPNTNNIISCTTRPRRDYEKDGVDYFFLSNFEFFKKVELGTMLETTEFNKWYYGTPIQALDRGKINIGVFNIDGIADLLAEPYLEVLPIYIYTYDEKRLKRSLNREKHPDCEEICRRFLADEKDFKYIPFNYIVYNNNSDYRDYFNIHNLPQVKKFMKMDKD